MSFLHYAVDVSLPQPLQVTSDPDNVLGQHVGNGSIDHCVLPWGTSLSDHTYGPSNLHPDYIIGSDITYDEDCYLPLLQTIAAYAWSNPHLKVILAMPDRQESASFLDMASAHGLIYRLLRHMQKPELLTPVSIFQFIFGPILSPEIRQLVCHGGLSRAHPPTVAGRDSKPGSESAHSPPTQRLAKQANSSVLSLDSTPAAVATSLVHLPSATVLDDPEPPGCVEVASAGEPDVHSYSAPAAAALPAAATFSLAEVIEGKAEVPATLLVLDFDWSMVEENSDTFVVRELGTWEAFQRLRAEQLPWTELMDKAMLAAHDEQGASAADVQAACAKVPMHPHMQEVLKQASANSAVQMVILSDANTVFIDHVLEAQALQGCFDSVITNPAEFCGGALRVGPYHTAPHGCASCPPNLCKGRVLEDLLLQHNYQQVVYLGDGKGDYCPCTRLGPNDCILARHSYPDGSPCALAKLLADQGAPIKDALQCLSSAGSAQKAASIKDSLQHLLPVAPDKQPIAAPAKRREQPTETTQSDTTETQGASKRHKGQGIEQSWGQGCCNSSHPFQQHQPGGEQPDAAGIDSEKCQDPLDASTIHQDAPCSDNLPLPPNMSNSEIELDKSRAFASLYTWAEAAEAAAMLRVLVNV